MSTYVLINQCLLKSLLNINSTEYDTRIDYLIPMIIEDINKYTNNYFITSTAYFYQTNWTLSSAKTITMGDTSFNFSNQLIAGNTIYLGGSKWNDGYYTVNTVASTQLTVNESINAESTNSPIVIYKADFPKDLSFIASQMIGYKLYNTGINIGQTKSTASESLGDYSISYVNNNSGANIGSYGYPISITNSLNKYRKLGMK